MHPDLVRRPIVNSKRARPAPYVDAERRPRKWLLKYPLPEIARKEKSVAAASCKRREKAQMGYAEILSFIDHDKVKGRFLAFSHDTRQHSKELCGCHQIRSTQRLPHPLKDRPQHSALLFRQPRFSA